MRLALSFPDKAKVAAKIFPRLKPSFHAMKPVERGDSYVFAPAPHYMFEPHAAPQIMTICCLIPCYLSVFNRDVESDEPIGHEPSHIGSRRMFVLALMG